LETDAISIRTPEASWTLASSIYGESVMYNGKDIVFVKQLTNRLEKGKGVSYLIKFIPPEGKMIRTVAVARSDEHVYILEGGHCYRNGEQRLFPGDYVLNPEGHPHAALVNIETVALVICTGATDEVKEISVIEPKL
jgi:mannose-6-phosphate isomerase-like protein (cupin superfamily)